LNKNKIINDPVYGFVSIPSALIFDLISHPYFQRLRYIRQLGMSELVYPGAVHTRFHHALGAMHLMGRALESLRKKKVDISAAEYEAAQIAILLHDIGHGPLSHALEETLLPGIRHETLSYLLMRLLHEQVGGLELALKIFRNSYERKFFHQLVSSQLDIDRLDYLKRDSFFTGVMEGTVGIDRIIAMLHVSNDTLVVEEKGIFSIESFLHARRLMYWQVYLHKTAVSAERMIVNIFRRASYLARAGAPLPASDALHFFMKNNLSASDLTGQPDVLHWFAQLDDHDIWSAVKQWRHHSDAILAGLCNRLLQRELFQIQLTSAPIKKAQIETVRREIHDAFGVLRSDANYLFSHGTLSNEAYVADGQAIHILMKSGQVVDIAEASDLPTIQAMSKIVKKNYLCWPKNLSLSDNQ